MRCLLVVVVEFRVVLAILIVSILPVVLSQNSITSKREERYHTGDCPEM
jgi:hypothetical protein